MRNCMGRCLVAAVVGATVGERSKEESAPLPVDTTLSRDELNLPNEERIDRYRHLVVEPDRGVPVPLQSTFVQLESHAGIIEPVSTEDSDTLPKNGSTITHRLEKGLGALHGARQGTTVNRTLTRRLGLLMIVIGGVLILADALVAASSVWSSAFTIYFVQTCNLYHTEYGLGQWFHDIGLFLFAAVALCAVFACIKHVASHIEKDDDVTDESSNEEGSYEWWRYRAFLILTEPHTSKCSLVYHLLSSIISIYSCITYGINTIAAYHFSASPFWLRFYTTNSWIINPFFTFEYIAGFWASRDRLDFVLRVWNIIDAMIVIPFWTSFNPHFNFMRIFRIFRIFRLMKVARLVDTLELLTEATRKSKDAFILLFLFLAIGCYLIAALIWEVDLKTWDARRGCWMFAKPLAEYRSESGKKPGDCMPYQSMPDALYYAITTMTTVGYGDITPGTLAGRVVGAFGMVLGVLVIALPVGVLSSHFEEAYKEFETKKALEKLHRLGDFASRDTVLEHLSDLHAAAAEKIGNAKLLLHYSSNQPDQKQYAILFQTSCDMIETEILGKLNQLSDMVRNFALPEADRSGASKEK